MSMTIWPWWRIVGDDSGVYEVLTFASVTLEAGGKSTPIVILKSLRGHLNAAVPLNEMHRIGMLEQATSEDAMVDNPDRARKVIRKYNKADGEERL
jgi:hypothetical protein